MSHERRQHLMGSLPWDGSDSIWKDDGPGGELEFELEGIKFKITPVGSASMTCRTLYRVECLSCGELQHHGTTSATIRVVEHLMEGCSSKEGSDE